MWDGGYPNSEILRVWAYLGGQVEMDWERWTIFR